MSDTDDPSPSGLPRPAGPPVPRFTRPSGATPPVDPPAPAAEALDAPTVSSRAAAPIEAAPPTERYAAAQPPPPPAPPLAGPPLAGPAPTGRPSSATLGVVAAGIIALVVVVAGVAVLTSRKEDDTPSTIASATATPVEAETVAPIAGDDGGDPEATPAPTEDYGEDTTPPNADDPSSDSGTPGRHIQSSGFGYDLPTDEWTADPTVNTNNLRYTRILYGPGGEVVRVIHTPQDIARPLSKYVVSRSQDDVSSSVSVIELEDFPVDECESSVCDDFLINDPAFGGVAVLASDSGGSASDAARVIARSIAEGA